MHVQEGFSIHIYVLVVDWWLGSNFEVFSFKLHSTAIQHYYQTFGALAPRCAAFQAARTHQKNEKQKKLQTIRSHITEREKKKEKKLFYFQFDFLQNVHYHLQWSAVCNQQQHAAVTSTTTVKSISQKRKIMVHYNYILLLLQSMYLVQHKALII